MYGIFRILLVAILAGILGGWSASDSQNRPATPTSPTVGATEAVFIASHLKIGISEKNVQQVMKAKGIPCLISMGCSHSWTSFGELTNGCCLALEMLPTGLFGAGQLTAAHIQSNGVKTVQIKFLDR
jgi:hypothetical protein